MPSPLPDPAPLPQGFPLPGPSPADRPPLLGLTILAVEDSRYACEALRLLSHRAGARLRRAETLAAARAHLRVYRPDVVIVDLGLPDGKGEGLIRELVMARPRPALVLGCSGNPVGRSTALAAGADGFLEKPLESLAAFCSVLLSGLQDPGFAPFTATPDAITPDPLALHDDLSHAAQLLAKGGDGPPPRYLAGFVQGVARHSHDAALADAAGRAIHPGGAAAFNDLRALIEHRLSRAGSGFARPPLPASQAGVRG